MMPPGGDLSKDRKVEPKVDMKKKTQAEIEQEMAALQYTNPMLLEVGGLISAGTQLAVADEYARHRTHNTRTLIQEVQENLLGVHL